MSDVVQKEAARSIRIGRMVVTDVDPERVKGRDNKPDYNRISVRTKLGRMRATQFNGLQFRQLEALEVGDVIALEVGEVVATSYINKDMLIGLIGFDNAKKVLDNQRTLVMQQVEFMDIKILDVDDEENALPAKLANRAAKTYVEKVYGTASGGVVAPPTAGGVGAVAAPVAGAENVAANPDEEKPW